MILWLVPVDERSFQRTLAEPVDLSDWDERPDSFPEEARIWGVRTDPEQGTWKRNRRNLERMERSDPMLIYRNEMSRYTATGRVGPMTRTEYVRDESRAAALHSTFTWLRSTMTRLTLHRSRSTICSATRSHSGPRVSGA